MKEMIGVATIHEVRNLVANVNDERKGGVMTVHCSWCTNCSGIVGD